MNFKQLWPTLIPVLGVLINAFSGVIGGFLGAHPDASLLAMTVITALANVVQPPTAKK